MLPETESSPETRKTGHRVADLAIGLTAIFVSFCSLGLAIHHGHTMERLVEANSRPFLQFSTSNGDPHLPPGAGRVLYVAVDNPGAGAARIERFAIEIDGHRVGDWPAALRLIREQSVAAGALPPGPVEAGMVSYSDVAPSYLRAGNEVTLLRWPRTEANGTLWDRADAARLARRVRLEACYCSIFDECWIADSASFRPKPVPAC